MIAASTLFSVSPTKARNPGVFTAPGFRQSWPKDSESAAFWSGMSRSVSS